MRLDVKAPQTELDKVDVRADAVLNQLKTMTPAQAAAWVDTHVTDLASAKTVLKAFAKIMVLLARAA